MASKAIENYRARLSTSSFGIVDSTDIMQTVAALWNEETIHTMSSTLVDTTPDLRASVTEEHHDTTNAWRDNNSVSTNFRTTKTIIVRDANIICNKTDGVQPTTPVKECHDGVRRSTRNRTPTQKSYR